MIRFITKKTGDNTWEIYKVTSANENEAPAYVGTLTDIATVTLLIQAPAQAIIDKTLRSPNKKHYLETHKESLDSFQSAMYKILKKL